MSSPMPEMPEMPETTPERGHVQAEDAFWRRLLYRWFVEYCPLYLVSAMLVLAGMIFLSRGLARSGSLHGEIGVAAIAEVYALALIGVAALLVRIGHRRPAVMLALLTVVYQCDLTLHTETCAHLGLAGVWATGAWLVLFVGKLRALTWAMEVRVSRAALATATLGAIGLALFPLFVPSLGARAGGAVIALWLSGLVFLHRPGGVTSLVALDAWGLTVLRRVVRASWILSAVLLTFHVLFWSIQPWIEPATIACVAPVLATRWMRREARVWTVVVVTLVVAALKAPGAFAATALVTAVALGARAFAAARSPDLSASPRPAPAFATPYRVLRPEAMAEMAASVLPAADPELVVPGGRGAMLRLATGAAFALYLSVWTSGWSGGPWPAHVIPLDVLMVVAVLVAAWRLRLRVALVPLAASCVHLTLQSRLVPAPRTLLEWGAVSVGLGFVLLVASLAVSYWLRSPRESSRLTGRLQPDAQ